jgi:uncharacterized protein YecE (DUF72 family)
LLEDLTADFVYLRLHGDKDLYASGCGDEALARWARRIDAWSRGRETGMPGVRRRTMRRTAVNAMSIATSTTT